MLSKLPGSFQRPQLAELLRRLEEPRRFLQVLGGPRQVGKTTLARQVVPELEAPSLYASADGPLLEDDLWLEQQWERGRLLAREEDGAVLFLDEVQKLKGWSETAKRLWDEDTASGLPLKVVILGSSPLLLGRGLTESLAGRFEVLRTGHWSFTEMRAAFGWDLDTFVFFGGYPGSASLIGDEERWRRYILDSLVEPVLGRDILLMTRIDKPVLLRQLLRLGCEYSGQILSYQKILGQLVEAGNTTTLAHYLKLLAGAGLLTGLEKYAAQPFRRRASSPKLQVLNTALMAAASPTTSDRAREDPAFWGRLVESAAGAWLVNASWGTNVEVFYWRHRNREVDYVLRRGKATIAIEVKSGRKKEATPGLGAFKSAFAPRRTLTVGTTGIPLEEFLTTPPGAWFEA